MGLNSNNRIDCCNHESSIGIPTMPSSEFEIHRVCLPPHRTTLQKLRHWISEIFFPDDPFHRFKNQTFFTKLLLALQFLFPIFQWGPHYKLRLLRSDFISGLTIASLAIPQVCTYSINKPHNFFFSFLYFGLSFILGEIILDC